MESTEICTIYYCNVNFSVNGIDGDLYDFGNKDSGGSDGNYGCLDMHFVPKKPDDEVLQTYGITETDYQIVVDMLCEELAFGCCGERRRILEGD